MLSGLNDESNFPAPQWDHVILHYANYGYQPRGVPFWLLGTVEKLRPKDGGVVLTVFHELYASRPPWESAFWLQPFQKRVAAKLSQISDRCVVSNALALEQLERLNPAASISVQPIPSNFGEPILTSDQLDHRDPHRWVICGGTALLERSLRSFLEICAAVPERARPHELFVVGGSENAVVRSLLKTATGFKIHYRPEVSVEEASEILSICSFGWIDYFQRPEVPTVVILKSGSFSALCAHGVVPVFPHSGSAIFVTDDYLRGPFFVRRDRSDLPQDRAETAKDIYEWYHRRVAWKHLARGVADALCLTK